MLSMWWFAVSTVAFVCGIVWLVVSGWVGYRFLSQLLLLLGDTRSQVQDLGDLAANAVGRAEETMDIVEKRVSETMGQATLAGVSVTRQTLGIGSLLAGLYMASRAMSTLRRDRQAGRHRKRGRRRK